MIGTSLPLGVLTDNPNQEADKRLLDAYGGSRALLAAFRKLFHPLGHLMENGRIISSLQECDRMARLHPAD